MSLTTPKPYEYPMWLIGDKSSASNKNTMYKEYSTDTGQLTLIESS